MRKIFLVLVLATVAASVFVMFWAPKQSVRVFPFGSYGTKSAYVSRLTTPPKVLSAPDEIKAVHLSYGIYFSDKFGDILKEIEQSEINAIVFEIKNPSGLVALNDGSHLKILQKLLGELNRRGIYTIARMVIFQDPALVDINPDLAIKDTRTGAPWADFKGIIWADPTNKAVWEYNLDIAKRAQDIGFSEINFDYIRFPTDGPTKYAVYGNLDKFETKENTIVNFLKFAKLELGANSTLSIDVFGMTFINDQLAIGQNIEKLALYADVLMPMPYPSHYPAGFRGLENPAEHPYIVILRTLESGLKKLEGQNVVVRPWLQDFDLGAEYGEYEIQEQIRALNDLDIDTWALWNASNRYTWSAVQ